LFLLRLPRALLAVSITSAALLTCGRLFVTALTTSPSARAAQAGGSLAGAWRSLANGDRVNRLLVDGDRVWSATDGGGLVRWELESPAYRQYLAPQDGLPSNTLHDLARDEAGRLWLATERGLTRFDPGTETAVTLVPESSPGMPARRVTALALTPEGRLWVGFSQEWDPDLTDPRARTNVPGAFRPAGLALYDPATGAWGPVYHAELIGTPGGDNETYRSIPSENITALQLGSDGILWVGTRPYYTWDARACPEGGCDQPLGYWVLAGGGLAATRAGAWLVWRSTVTSGTCYSNEVTALAADVDGRMWVGTAGRGVLVMRDGFTRRGCAFQTVYQRPRQGTAATGLRGDMIWSLDIDDQGRLWIGQGEGRDTGLGIAILTHHGTFADTSPWQSDDQWTHLDLDGAAGPSDALVTALAVHRPGIRLIGGQDLARGDGPGVRRYDETNQAWQAWRTADNGLPSNQVTAMRYAAAAHQLWFAFQHRGVARWDELTGEWRWWQMLDAGRHVASVTAPAKANDARVTVDLTGPAQFDAAFPPQARLARVGGDPTLYTVSRYVPLRNGIGPFIELSPRLRRPAPPGTAIWAVERALASDDATQIALDAQGRPWVGGRKTIWQNGGELGTTCPTFPQCWFDGGLATWDGSAWTVFNQRNSDIPDQAVSAVEVDAAGRVWVGTGDGVAGGGGLGVHDPTNGQWVRYDQSTRGFGGNGVADLDVDPATGDVWVAQYPAATWVEDLAGNVTRVMTGGGVSRWNGASWTNWKKKDTAMAAYGQHGFFVSILVDRVRDRVWAGSWDAEVRAFHWLSGWGVDAALSWCPVDTCTADSWQSTVWPEDGQVAALELDALGRLWVGTNRRGAGIVPPVAGVKLYDGTDWSTLTPDNAGLVSNEITALAAGDNAMWVGSLRHGVSIYGPVIPPTPTPTASPTPTRTPTLEPTPTLPASATPTSGVTPWPTAEPTASLAACGPASGHRCGLFVPLAILGLAE
jgi:hypothetical protein